MVRGAIGTLAELSGVRIINAVFRGRPVGVVFFGNTCFGEDEEGFTTFEKAELIQTDVH